jgi:hypothetical protein
MHFFWGFFRQRFADRRSIIEIGKQGPSKRNHAPQ